MEEIGALKHSSMADSSSLSSSSSSSSSSLSFNFPSYFESDFYSQKQIEDLRMKKQQLEILRTRAYTVIKKDELGKTRKPMRVLEKPVVHSNQDSITNTSLGDLQQKMTRLMTQCDENDVAIKLSSARIRILREHVKNKDIEIEKLKLENLQHLKKCQKLLKDQNVCKVCFESQTTTVLLPCRHFGLCKRCSLACSDCPFCRLKIAERIFVFAC